MQALDMVQRDVDGLSESCKQTTSALSVSRASTTELLAAMEQVQRDLEISERRSQLVHTFLEQYQLSTAELSALQVRPCPNRAAAPRRCALAESILEDEFDKEGELIVSLAAGSQWLNAL